MDTIRKGVNDPDHSQTPLQGLKIIVDAGNGAGGFFADKDESHGLFKDYISLLHEQGFATLRFDVTGLGESNKDLENVIVPTWLEDSYQALNLFHTSGIEQIGIVGFSLGAAYAILNYSYL